MRNIEEQRSLVHYVNTVFKLFDCYYSSPRLYAEMKNVRKNESIGAKKKNFFLLTNVSIPRVWYMTICSITGRHCCRNHFSLLAAKAKNKPATNTRLRTFRVAI